MKAIVLGFGSIGKRHTKNLLKLGVDVRTVDIDEIDDIDTILSKDNFDFGLVCTPTNLHLEHTLKLAENGLDFFCEKPFYSKKSFEILNKIRKLIKDKSLINMVGCNLRFHPIVKSFDSSDVNNIKVFFGYDLRKWHNDGNHLKLYSANKNMGGGVMLDVIHEFDYLYNWFGEIERVEGVCKKVSDVTNDTEDTVDAFVSFKNGVVAEVHLDYLQSEYTRYFKAKDTEVHNIKPNDEQYIEEIKYFIDCVKSRKKCMNDINEASYLIDKLTDGITKSEF